MTSVSVQKEKQIAELLAKYCIQDIEDHLLKEEQEDLDLNESIVNGMYVRKILIPAGTVLISKVWLEPYLDIMVSGDITVFTEYGTKRLTGLNIMPGRKLRKRVGVSHEDTLWITVHRTDSIDVHELEDCMTCESVEEGVEVLSYEAEVSYLGLLDQLGLTEPDVQKDMLTPVQSTGASVKESNLAGVGTFASKDHPVGDIIGFLTLNGVKTDYGRFTNHSPNPNTLARVHPNGDLVLVACKYVHSGEEFLVNYKDNLELIGRLECQQ